MKFDPKTLSLYLAAAVLVAPLARADVTQVSEDAIASQPSDIQLAGDEGADEVVVIRKPQKRHVVVEENETGRNSVGNSIDSTINKKLDDARDKMAEKLANAIDKMQINVGDNASSATPVVTQQVQDNVTQTAAAPEKVYVAVPSVEPENKSEAKAEEEGLKGSVGISPVFGVTTLNSQNYNIDSRYTAGIGLEVDVNDYFSFTVGYRYSQYNVGLAAANQPTYYYYGNNQQTLEYNQNVLDATGRYYILPKNYRFRLFMGAGVGYNKGFLNYNQKTLDAYNANPYYAASGQLDDYEVSSVLGILEAGGELQLSRSIAVGVAFKYHSVLSSRENQPLNNTGFYPNYNYNYYGAPTDKSVIGGSLRENSFYSLLGSVKLSF